MTAIVSVSCLILSLGICFIFFIARIRVFQLIGQELYARCRKLTHEHLANKDSPAARVRRYAKVILYISLGLFVHWRILHPHWDHIGDAWPASVLLAGAVASLQKMPATIILLGASAQNCYDLQRRLNRKLFPLRAVSFLLSAPNSNLNIQEDIFRYEIDHKRREALTLRNKLLFGNSILFIPPSEEDDDNAWREIVYQFILNCPIVIFDYRKPTKAVDEEFSFAMRKGAGPKIICLRHKGSTRNTNSLAIVNSETELLSLLVPISQGRQPMPSPRFPLKERI